MLIITNLNILISYIFNAGLLIVWSITVLQYFNISKGSFSSTGSTYWKCHIFQCFILNRNQSVGFYWGQVRRWCADFQLICATLYSVHSFIITAQISSCCLTRISIIYVLGLLYYNQTEHKFRTVIPNPPNFKCTVLRQFINYYC